MRLFEKLAPILVAAVVWPAPGAAQSSTDLTAGQLYATRAQLENMLAKYEAGSESAVYSDAVRMPSGDEAELIRLRLERGDFEVGDIVSLTVSGQPNLTNDFTVVDGQLLLLPEVDEFSLRGVLRSELRERLTEHLALFIRDPRVFVQTKVTIFVDGDVGAPGIHTVPAESRLTEVLVLAGQPLATARLDKMKVKRRDETIWDGEDLQQAMIQGRTIDQLNLRAGDTIEVPGQSSRNWGEVIRSLYYLVPLSLALSRIF